YLSNLAVGCGRVRLFNGLTIFYSIMAIAAALIIAVAGGSTFAFLLGAATALAIPTIFGSWRVLTGQWRQFRPDVARLRRCISYATKVYLAAVFGFIMTRIGAFALQHQSSIEEVGQFSVASQFADGLTLLPSTVAILLFTKLMRAETRQRWSMLWQ